MKAINTFEHCMQVARDYFDKNFHHQIKDLLTLFPPDAKNNDGTPFWSGPKRCPNPIEF